MATNEVFIELVLEGAEKAIDGLSEIGETTKLMAQKFDKENSKLGEGLSSLTGNVKGVITSVKGLGTAVGATGGSFLSLIGPIGAVVAAGYALYETYQNISGAAEEAERSQEALKAAVADLQSKLEALSEKGIVPTTEELQAFTLATIKSQVAKEKLQIAIERGISPAIQRYEIALSQLEAQQKKLREATGLSTQELQHEAAVLLSLEKNVKRQEQSISKALDTFTQKQKQVSSSIRDAAKEDEKLQEKSKEATIARIKENQARFDELLLMDTRAKATSTTAVKELEIYQKAQKAILDARLESIKDNRSELAELDKNTKARLAALDSKTIIEKAALKDVEDIRKTAREKEQAEEEKARVKKQAQRVAANAAAQAMARQRQAEEAQIRQLGYEKLRLDGVAEIDLLKRQYDDSLKLVGDNANKKLIIEMKYQNDLQRLQQEQQARLKADMQEQARLEAENQARLAEQRQAFIYSTMEFDSQRIEDETERQLAQLELRYNKEIALNEYTQDQITELQRRQAIEREEIVNASIDSQIQKVGEFTNQYGAGLAEAAYNSLLFGESFQESVGQMLIALGRQAAVESLMETAKGTAALFANPALASSHFAAAGLFAGAAATAGLAGKALGGGASGGGGGASSASPTGTPQTAPTPQREQADTQAMVFNINFGGAVIYDTQRAAEQALADRITNLQNTRRRGAPRRSF